MTLALQATGITRRFPGVLANDHVNFSLERGEIHALLGENGAGMVHQHFMLVPPLTVTENIMLGQESTTSGTQALGELAVLDRRAISRRVRDLSRHTILK